MNAPFAGTALSGAFPTPFQTCTPIWQFPPEELRRQITDNGGAAGNARIPLRRVGGRFPSRAGSKGAPNVLRPPPLQGKGPSGKSEGTSFLSGNVVRARRRLASRGGLFCAIGIDPEGNPLPCKPPRGDGSWRFSKTPLSSCSWRFSSWPHKTRFIRFLSNIVGHPYEYLQCGASRRSPAICGRAPGRNAIVRLRSILNGMCPTETPAERVVVADFRVGGFLSSALPGQGVPRLTPQTLLSLGYPSRSISPCCPARQKVPPKCVRNLRRCLSPLDGHMGSSLRGSYGRFSGYAFFALASDALTSFLILTSGGPHTSISDCFYYCLPAS